MSDLIRRRRSVTTTPSSDPPPQSASAATAPAQMDQLAVGPWGPRRQLHRLHQWRSLLAPGGVIGLSAPPTPHRLMLRAHSQKNTRGPCQQLKTAKVTWVTNSRINIVYDKRHRAAPTPELHSSLGQDIGHVLRTHCPMQWKSWKVMPDEIKTEVRGQLSTNYNLEDLDNVSLAYVNRLFSERYKQWTSDLHHYFEAFEAPEAPDFVNKAKVNKGNRKKKTLLHHSGSRPFSYRMDARHRGSKFPEIDVFDDVYVRLGNELAESLHVNDDGGEEPIGSSGVRLPASSRDSNRVCGSSIGCWVSDPEGDVGSDSREEAGDILSRDGECPAEGTQTPSSSAVKSGNCFDCTGGHASESDVSDSGVPCTIRHSNPVVSCVDLRARPPRASPVDHGPYPNL
ncbi:unnamed protein product [Prunus armeniaca]